MVGETRDCEQCGMSFALRREHARFCSARCRLAWNRDHAGDPATVANALDWSITAMAEATGRLIRSRGLDLPRVTAAIGEAVWWVTIVDAALVRYHPASYDRVLAGRPCAERQRTEETLAGLRFVRNQMGRQLEVSEFVRASRGVPSGPGSGRITTWQWNPLPEPTCSSLSPAARHWELTRYQGYRRRLAGRDITETFRFTANFLTLTAMTGPAAVAVHDG